jgi:hypothetical protein
MLDPRTPNVDYKQLLKKTSVGDRLRLMNTTLAKDILSQLTPIERAKLFPKYYLDRAPAANVPPSQSLMERFFSSLVPPRPDLNSYAQQPRAKASQPAQTAEPTKPDKKPDKKTEKPPTKHWINDFEEKTGVKVKEPAKKDPPKTHSKYASDDKLGRSSDGRAHKRRIDIPKSVDNRSASVRYNNPGASYPRERDNLFGIEGYGVIGGGHLIGKYPSLLHGLASNMDLMKHSKNYAAGGKSLQQATNTWRGRKSPAPTFTMSDGTVIDGSTILTDELMNNREFVTTLFKHYAQHEAGLKDTVTEDELNQAFDIYIAGGIDAYKEQRKAEEIAREDAEIEEQKEIAKESPHEIIPEKNQTGKIFPDIGFNPVEPELPENADPEVRKYYDGLNSEERTRFNKILKEVGIDNVNQAAKDHAGKVLAEAAEGKASVRSKPLDYALEMLGQHEVRNKETIKKYLLKGGQQMDPESLAWCGAFVNSSLEQAGIRSLGRRGWAASSWQNWGENVDDPTAIQEGNVVTNKYSRHDGRTRISPGALGGHVGIATGKTRMHNGKLQVQRFSGNSSNKAGYEWVDADSVVIRRAREEDYYTDEEKQLPPTIITPNTDADVTAERIAPPGWKPEVPEEPLVEPESTQEMVPEAPQKPADGVSEPQATQTPPPTTEAVKPAPPAPTAEPQVTPDPPKADAPAGETKPVQSSPDVPMMKSGGEVQSSGEDLSIVDNNSNRKIGEVNRGENIRFNKKGRVEVTPAQRIDPRSLEGETQARQSYHDREANQKQEVPQSRMMQGAKTPEKPPTNFTSHEQWGHTETPTSYVRAMAQAKGRKHDGSFPGSRFGEEQLGAI